MAALTGWQPGFAGTPYCPVCWARSKFRTSGRGSLSMRETVIIAAACFLIFIMAAALIVHFVVP
jgi:hypothetical protein